MHRVLFLRFAAAVGVATLLATCTAAPPVAAPAVPAVPIDLVAYAATAPLGATVPLDSAVRQGRLPNGLTFLVRANPRPEQRAELRLVVDAGSLQEDEDQRGLAHFVEHMAFNGTRRFAKQELVDYLQSIGLRFGADTNASTSFDETVYQLTVPTDDPAILARAFEILADWAGGITFDPVDVDEERGVLVEEWRLGRGAGARLREIQLPVLFYGSRYAERLPIGQREVLETAPPEALKRFYRDWYRPDLMAVVAVGDFDPADIEARIRDAFAALPAAADPRPRHVWPLPEHAATLVSIATDPEVTRTSVTVYDKRPRPAEGTFGDYRRKLVEALYSGMIRARLGEVAQRPDPPYLFGAVATTGLTRTADALVQAAGVEEGGVVRGLSAVATEVERARRHGFSAAELERVKKDLLRGYEETGREQGKLDSAGFAAEYTRHFLEGEPIPGIAAEVEIARRFMPEITLAEVEALARTAAGEGSRVILISAPTDAEGSLPSEDELLAIWPRLEQAALEPWLDEVRDEPLLAELPTPRPVVEELARPALGVTEWRLEGGARVILKPTDFQNQEIYLRAFSPGGHSLVDDARHTSAQFATAVLGEGGAGGFRRLELDKALAGTVVTVRPRIGELEETLSGFTAPQDVETFFQLLYLTLTQPRADREAFTSFTERLTAQLVGREADPGTVFRDRLVEVLTDSHPRRRPLSTELVGEIDLDDALAIYRDRFADFSDFTFILVGSFEVEAMRPLVERYLGGLPMTGRQETWRDVGVRPPATAVDFEVVRGLEPRAQVSLTFSTPADFTRRGRHAISTLAAILRARLREILREDMGAVYGVSVDGGLERDPEPWARFSIGFGCAPEAVEELVAEVMAEIERARREGFDDVYLANERESQRRQREVALRENTFWVAVLESYFAYGFDPELILAHDELVAGITNEAMRQAVQTYIDPGRRVFGVLLPEAAAGAAPGSER